MKTIHVLIVTCIFCLLACKKETPIINLATVEAWDKKKINKHRKQLLETTIIEGDIKLTDDALEAIDAFDNVEKITGKLEICFLESEGVFSGFPNLEEVYELSFSGNDDITALSFDQLTYATRNIIVIFNHALLEVSFPELVQAEHIGVYENRLLEKVDLPNVSNILYGIQISETPKFKRLEGLTKIRINEAEYFERMSLEMQFDIMSCPADLLIDSNLEGTVLELKINNIQDSDFTWLTNIKKSSSTHIKGDLNPSDLCSLKGWLLENEEAEIRVTNTSTIPYTYYSRDDIINNCL